MNYRRLSDDQVHIPMATLGAAGAANGVAGAGIPSPSHQRHKVPLVIAVFLIFYGVSGGPFGIEDTVGAAGPLLAILGFVIFPFIWSVPEALITAEMATMFPENSGYVVWVSSAFGPFWGFQQGWIKWISGVIDNALYPVLLLDYLKSSIPAVSGGAPRVFSVIGITVALTVVNYLGLNIVGSVAIFLGIISILPFFIMGLVAIPKIQPRRWLAVDRSNIDWNLYLNTLFWNLNYWDGVSTLAGEVANPSRTIPKALFSAVILVVVTYVWSLLAGTGAIPLDRDSWTDGYFAVVAKLIGGAWLMWWVQVAAALSNIGMFLTEMSGDSFQLLGMAERGFLPGFFARRSRFGTPPFGILFSACGVLFLSWMTFQEIVAAENFLYAFGTAMEFSAFLMLRIKHPDTPRPYRVPLGTVGCGVMLLFPFGMMIAVLAFSTLKVAAVSLAVVAVGLVLRPCLLFAEKKQWLKFSVNADLPDIKDAAGGTAANGGAAAQ